VQSSVGATLAPIPHFALAMAITACVGYFSHLVADMLVGGLPWPMVPLHSQRVTRGHFKTTGGFDHFLGWLCLAGVVDIVVQGGVTPAGQS